MEIFPKSPWWGADGTGSCGCDVCSTAMWAVEKNIPRSLEVNTDNAEACDIDSYSVGTGLEEKAWVMLKFFYFYLELQSQGCDLEMTPSVPGAYGVGEGGARFGGSVTPIQEL